MASRLFLGGYFAANRSANGTKSENTTINRFDRFMGALLLLNADTIARTVLAPKELSTSAVLLAISGPLFVLMLIRGGRHA